MRTKSDSIKFTSYNNTNRVVNGLLESLHSRYQGNLEISMRSSDFIFDSVQLMCYKCHKVTFRRGDSYIHSPGWIKQKKQR